jgi:hypothetical protein
MSAPIDKTKALAKAVIDLAASPGSSAMSVEAVHAQKKAVKLFFESLRLDKELKAQLIALKNQCVFQVGAVNPSSEKVLKIAMAFFSYPFKDEAAAVAFIRGVVETKSAAPAKNVSFVALYEFCKPAFVGGGTAAQAQKYIAADFSLTEDPSKRADVFSLILNLQQRVHAFKRKKETDIKKELNAIQEILKRLRQLFPTVSGKLMEVFEKRITETARHCFSALPSFLTVSSAALVATQKAIGAPSLDFMKSYSMLLDFILDIKNFVHCYSRYGRIATEFNDYVKKSSSMLFLSPVSFPEMSKPILAVVPAGVRANFDRESIDLHNRYQAVSMPKTFEGFAFLFRWFHLNKDDDAKALKVYGLASLIPQTTLSDSESAKFKEKYCKHPNPEVAALARNFLKYNVLMQKTAIHAKALKQLKEAYEKVKDFQNILPGFEAFGQFAQATGPHILRLQSLPVDIEMEEAKKHAAIIISDLIPAQTFVHAYYTYLYRDFQWDAQSRKVQKTLMTPEEFSSLQLVSTADTLEEEETDKKGRKLGQQVIARIGIPFPKIDQKDQKTPVSKTAVTGAAERPQRVASLLEELVAELAPTAAAPAEKPQAVDPIERLLAEAPFKDGIVYAPRVLEWFESPEGALERSGNATKAAPVQRKIVLFHAFSQQLDRFVGTEYSVETSDLKLGRTQYSLPVQVTWKGVPFFARIDYTFDEQNVCFHRCITEKSLEEFFTTFREFQFPPLEQSAASKAGNKKKLSPATGQVKVEFDPALETILVADGSLQIQLMRVR